jgi:hypothetical protein
VRRALALVLVLFAPACGGGGGEPGAVVERDCLAAWNAADNPHRGSGSVPDTMGAANVSRRVVSHSDATGCSYLFHDFGRFVSFEGRWGEDGLEWEPGRVSRGEWTLGRQRSARDDFMVAADGRLRPITQASRSWGRFCDPVGASRGRRYELCREPPPAGPVHKWTRPALIVEEGGARRIVRVEPPPGRADQPVHGSWYWGALSPDGRTLLLHWSAECEIPIAFLAPAEGGRPREAIPGAFSSYPLGWWGGRAVVAEHEGCGMPKLSRLHLVDAHGAERTRVTMSDRWQGDFRELVDNAGGDLGAVLRRCGIALEGRRPQTIRLTACR